MDYITILSHEAQKGNLRATLYLGLAYLFGIPKIVEIYPEEAQYLLSKIRSHHPEWLIKYREDLRKKKINIDL